ncbi:glycosyltransferase [Lapidilactobacillus dextrinicus]|uniref:glycosyltransferase n=1 Tax=Lapidilactobacillus dextrinicus TaxID=51664 RepID=UPI003F23648E
MIFVTVGTHEQPFNRLIETVDKLKATGQITESVFIQTGYSTYTPQFCKHQAFISMNQMSSYMKDASVIVTHGGPSSFIMALQHQKTPIVVPRLKKFNEHVNDHQLKFCQELKIRKFPIILVTNMENLDFEINKQIEANDTRTLNSHNKKFMDDFSILIHDLMEVSK